jgi:YD repeat-containing protein
MTAVIYTTNQLLLTWQGVSGYSWYFAELYQPGESKSQAVPALQYAFPGSIIGTGWQCTVRALSTDQVCIGPAAGPYALILTAPVMTEMDYDAATLSLAWTPVTDSQVTSNLLQLASGGGNQQFPLGNSGSQDLPVSLSATQTYTVTLRAANGIVLGPWSQALVAITAVPGSVFLGFDGTELQGMWQLMTQSQVTGYLASLSGDGTIISTLPSASGSVAFGQALTAGTVFSLRARATGVQVKGPWSAEVTGPYAAAWAVTYDPFGRLWTLTWNGTTQQQWQYDAAGNILSAQLTPPTAPPGGR